MKRMRFQIGLKLFSVNGDLIDEVLRLYAEDWFDFIELMVIPGTFADTRSVWKRMSIPVVIHAPHSGQGVNLADKRKEAENRQKLHEAQMFADLTSADKMIVHGGHNGDLSELVRQLRELGDPRLVLENKPKMGLQGELCIGFTPDELRQVVQAVNLAGTALDFGHATYAACSLQVDAMDLIHGFLAFAPVVFHLSDGDRASEKDMHLNFGKGNFDLGHYCRTIPDDALVTLETPRRAATGLADFKSDVLFLRALAAEDSGNYAGTVSTGKKRR